MRYSLGLDIGSESVGWGIVELDEHDSPMRIVGMGVRAFDAVRSEAVNATTPAEERRLARSQRRRLRRRRRRMRRVAGLLADHKVVTSRADLEQSVLITQPGDSTPWELRVQGLDRKLEPREWARVLFHIARHRGFKSTRRAEQVTVDKSEAERLGKMLTSISEVHRAIGQHDYRTVAEYFESPEWRQIHGSRRRNKGGEYICTVGRDDLIHEVHMLFETQRSLGNPHASPDMERAYIAIVDEPPRLAEGPELMSKVGRCFLEPSERRAPKATLTAQQFRASQTLVNQSLINTANGMKRRLEPPEIQRLMDEALSVKQLKYKRALKVLGLENDNIWLFEVRGRKKGRDLRELQNEVLLELKPYHQLRTVLETSHPETWERLRNDTDLFDQAASALTYWLRKDTARDALLNLGIENGAADVLAEKIAFDGHMHLSLKAMRNLIPLLKEGLTYSAACAAAGYDHSCRPVGERHDRIPPLDTLEDFQSIVNPNVKRALTQARKLVNALIAEYGRPQRIVVELAREAAQSPRQRREIETAQDNNRKEKEAVFKRILEVVPTADPERVWRKYVLYEQQAGRCAYSMVDLDLERVLTDPAYAEIDHIIPRSVSFDDSMNNKVLVFTRENRDKGNQLAAAYVLQARGEEHYRRYAAWVSGLNIPPKKKRLLLTAELSDNQQRDLTQRYLVSTQYAARYFLNLLKDYLNVPKVLATNGRVTADLRYHLGLGDDKNRQLSDKHHALDAIICALVDEKVLQQMARYFRAREMTVRTPDGVRVHPKTGEVVVPPVLEPWPGFRDAAKHQLDLVIVSRMPNRRLSGRGHKETIYSLRHARTSGLNVPEHGRIALSPTAARPSRRTALAQLSEKQIREILMEPSPVLIDEAVNWRLYGLVRERLSKTDDGPGEKWAQRAFGPHVEPLRMPTNDGSPGPIVRSIRLYTDILNGVAVRGGIAESDSIVRLDLYMTQDDNGKRKHYVVPVYAADVAAGWIPARAAAAGKTEDSWPIIDDSFVHLFCLHPGDCFRVWKSPDEPGQMLYMTSFDRASVVIKGNPHDRSNRDSQGRIRPVRVSVTTAWRVEKIEIDLLGRPHTVRTQPIA